MSSQNPPRRRSAGGGTARPRARPACVVRPRARVRRRAHRPAHRDLRPHRAGREPAQRRPAGEHPAVERGRRQGGVRTGAPGPGGVGAHLAGGALGDPAPAARPGARAAGRDHRPDLLGVRQGAQARVRRAAAHRADRALLRAHRPPAPRHPAQDRRRTRAHAGRGQPGAQGRRGDHLAVELPVHDGALRRAARAARRQRRGRQARRPDHALGAARRPSCSTRPASPRTCGRSSPAPAASSAAR